MKQFGVSLIALSVDPHADRYWWVTPYAYCNNNPIKIVDPDGRDIVITGSASGEAATQLENKTSNKFNLIHNSDGSMSYEGKARTRNDKYIKGVIDDKNVTVNITAENKDKFVAHDGQEYNYHSEKGEIGGGAYGGSTVSSDGKATAYQYVNPQRLADWDKAVGDSKSGGYMLHEVAEGYSSGKMAFRSGKGDAVGGARYDAVHRQANRISGGNWHPIFREDDRINIKTGTIYTIKTKIGYIRTGNLSLQ